uniref:C-type lectin domain-containing protein n=1 Tax=Branchiostoma floridae TaxID=7739 RepID=C3ZNZ5_BRAFL|eukprot:XP_002589719.1 hypothetical protein BRAFLDRAFT_100843 [Branchiostoma floridae]
MSGGQQLSQTGDIGTTPMQQPQTDWQARADAAARVPNPMHASGEGTTPIQQPQTDWQARADAAARVPNPMHASGEGTTPMQQPQTDWQARADATASFPNPMYASGEGTTPIQQPQTDWQARTDATARFPNPMYASGEAMQQPQTDWQARADSAARVPNPMYASGEGEAINPMYRQNLEGTDPDTDLRPDSMEPYAVRYQDEDADDDNGLSQQRGDAGSVRGEGVTSGKDAGISGTSRNDTATSGNDDGTTGNDDGTTGNDDGTTGNDAGTSGSPIDDRNKRATHKARHGQHVPNSPLQEAGDCAYPDGTSGLGALCTSIRSQQGYMVAGIAMLLSLVAVGLAPLTFINIQEIHQLSTTLDALKHNQDDIRQLSTTVKCDKDNISTTVDALKRNEDDMRQLSSTVDALKHKQDNMSATVDALKSDQDNMSTTVSALKRNQENVCSTVDASKRNQDDIHQMSTTVETSKRDQDDMRQLSTIVDALKRGQDMRQLSTTVDALKRDQDDMRQLSATVDALKRDQDDMTTTVDALKLDQDDMSTTVDALKRDQDDMRQLSTTVGALKRDQDDMRQLSTTVGALKRGQDNMRQLSTTVDALKRDQDDMRQLSATVDALKRDQDDMTTTVDALKLDQDDMSTTVDALKRDQDDMRQLSTTVGALKRGQDGMSTTFDALRRDLDMERSRTAALEQRLHEMSKTLASCPEGYMVRNGICYKAFNTEKTFSDAALACRDDGGTLAMPRDNETNAFMILLQNTVGASTKQFWIGLHNQRATGYHEHEYEWLDGTALGTDDSWAQGEPKRGAKRCVLYFSYRGQYYPKNGGQWRTSQCFDRQRFRFICQTNPDLLVVFPTFVGDSIFPASCPKGYRMWNKTCYKAFDTDRTFTDAAAACGEDGGTLAMPRDAGTNAFLVSLSVSGIAYCIGLHDQRKEGHFDWVDGSALETYNNWGPGEVDSHGRGNRVCTLFSDGGTWHDRQCGWQFSQVVPDLIL